MKVCPNCKISYDDKYGFCKKCGQKLEVHIEQSQEHFQSPVFDADNTKLAGNVDDKNTSKKWIMIIGVLIILALIGFLEFGGNLSSEPNSQIAKTETLNNTVKENTEKHVKDEVDKEARAAAEKIRQEKQSEAKSSVQNNDTSNIEVNAPGYILDDDVAVWSAPDVNSKVLGLVYKGNRFIIINYSGKWAKIRGKDGIGYVLKSFISTNGQDVNWSNNEKYGKEVHSAVVMATDVNMRDSNSMNSNVIGRFNQGETVKVLGFYKEWVKVQRNNGQIGYIFRTYLDY